MATYQWQRSSGASWTNIGGSTGLSYTLQVADVGLNIRCRETVSGLDAFTSPIGPVQTQSTVTLLKDLSYTVGPNPGAYSKWGGGQNQWSSQAVFSTRSISGGRAEGDFVLVPGDRPVGGNTAIERAFMATAVNYAPNSGLDLWVANTIYFDPSYVKNPTGSNWWGRVLGPTFSSTSVNDFLFDWRTGSPVDTPEYPNNHGDLFAYVTGQPGTPHRASSPTIVTPGNYYECLYRYDMRTSPTFIEAWVNKARVMARQSHPGPLFAFKITQTGVYRSSVIGNQGITDKIGQVDIRHAPTYTDAVAGFPSGWPGSPP